MPRPSKRHQKMEVIRQLRHAKKRCLSASEIISTTSTGHENEIENCNTAALAMQPDMNAHWEGYDSEETDEEEYEFTDNEDEADVEAARNAFDILMSREDLPAKDNQA